MTKYPNVIPEMLNTSLLYHSEIDMNVPIKLMSTEPFDFEKIKERLYDAVRNPQKIFSPSQELKSDLRQPLRHEVKQTPEKQKPIIDDEEKAHHIKQRRGPRM